MEKILLKERTKEILRKQRAIRVKRDAIDVGAMAEDGYSVDLIADIMGWTETETERLLRRYEIMMCN